MDSVGNTGKWIFCMKKLNFVFHLFFVNLIDFVFLIQIMFLEYLYSVVVLTSNINRSLATARDRHSDRGKQLFGNDQSFGNILFIFIIYTFIHVGKVSIRLTWKSVFNGKGGGLERSYLAIEVHQVVLTTILG